MIDFTNGALFTLSPCSPQEWLSGLGKVRLEFRGSVDIRNLGQLIAAHVL